MLRKDTWGGRFAERGCECQRVFEAANGLVTRWRLIACDPRDAFQGSQFGACGTCRLGEAANLLPRSHRIGVRRSFEHDGNMLPDCSFRLAILQLCDFGLPAFYTLHVWAWKESPTGTFVNWHADVSCDAFTVQ